MFKRILSIFFGNLLFKIFAIVLAVSVWLLAVMLRTHTVNVAVPVEYTNLPADLIITRVNSEKVTAAFAGHGIDFLKFLFRPPKYEINLSLAKLGINRVKLAPDELVISSPVLLKSVVPEYAEIMTDVLESKKVNVVIPFRLEPKKGFYVTNVLTQDTVTLFGPQKEIDLIEAVPTESLFISEYSAPQISMKLYLVVPDTKLFRTKPESVVVVASIEKETTRVYDSITVNISVSSQYSAIVKPKIAQITLSGPTSIVRTIQISDIKVAINGTKLPAGDYKVPAEIVLPKKIFLSRCEPKMFEVRIK